MITNVGTRRAVRASETTAWTDSGTDSGARGGRVTEEERTAGAGLARERLGSEGASDIRGSRPRHRSKAPITHEIAETR